MIQTSCICADCREKYEDEDIADHMFLFDGRWYCHNCLLEDAKPVSVDALVGEQVASVRWWREESELVLIQTTSGRTFAIEGERYGVLETADVLRADPGDLLVGRTLTAVEQQVRGTYNRICFGYYFVTAAGRVELLWSQNTMLWEFLADKVDPAQPAEEVSVNVH